MLCIDREVAGFLAGLTADELRPVIERDGVVLSRLVAARLCRRTPEVLTRAMDEGTLPAVNAGKHRYIRPADLARWAGRPDYDLNTISAALGRTAATKEKTSVARSNSPR